jgi:hypothetical protein
VSEHNIVIEDIGRVASGEVSLAVSFSSQSDIEFWPIGFAFPGNDGCVTLTGDGGNIVFACSERSMDPVLPVFCVIDGDMQVRSDSEITGLSVVATKSDGELLNGFAKVRSTGHMSSMSKPRIEEFPAGRIVLSVIVEKPSQITIDLMDGNDAHAGVTIAHEDSDGMSWANVYLDIHRCGIWIPEKRRKLGWFDYAKNAPYFLCLVVSREEDTAKVHVHVTVKSGNATRKLRDDGILENSRVDRIRIRESASAAGAPGSYVVEVLGK